MSDCLFCKIVKGEIPCKKIHEDDEMLAFHDINPMAPVHFLVIPKKHVRSLLDLEAGDVALAGRLLNKAQELAKEPGPGGPEGCGEKGARFVINARSDGGQTVDHLHVHVLGGRALGWPPG
ncbi:MAG: histidine triad nucleotide-binding protein [Treponema sp.]|jgi:histidine triad (HIT) family protein|nr:histidine triad nucleotide-binding protein [Treponema sp.]